ncbi:MAG: XdhC family protein [Proteobacteria bacterium]|nr:XdhC family protein [Pseudomonadota bacterium]
MKREVLERLQEHRAAHRPVVLITDLESGEQQLILPGDDAVAPGLRQAARDALASDRSGTVETAASRVFVRPFNPPLRLVLVGAVHIAQPLARMAGETGYEVIVVDPRSAFATESRFPGVRRLSEWPDAALPALSLDSRCAVVTLTHDPKLDDPALDAALRSDVFYIGSLGSRKTHASRLARLRVRGFDDDALARIRGPVGLAIGARSPAEIAVSILAEITAALRRATP